MVMLIDLASTSVLLVENLTALSMSSMFAAIAQSHHSDKDTYLPPYVPNLPPWWKCTKKKSNWHMLTEQTVPNFVHL